MNSQKILVVVLLVFALILGGAAVLYDRLGQELEMDQLSTQPTLPPETTGPADPSETTEATEPELPKAPDFTAYDKNGNQVRLSDYFGKPIVLNFWASWCGPCQMEMPDFQEKYLELGEEIQFLMINMTDGSRETLATATSFLAQKGYTFPVLFDHESDAAMAYGAYSLPTTYFIDAEGHAIARATGAIDAQTLQQGIDMIVKAD